jgi:small subunit ribosomal protein S10e
VSVPRRYADALVQIYEALFKDGVLVAPKDFNRPTHPDITTVRNLEVIKAMQSLTSKGFVKTQFSWQYYYYTLTDEGLAYLREFLHLPSEIVPQTHMKPARPAGRPAGYGAREGGRPGGDGAYRAPRGDREYRRRDDAGDKEGAGAEYRPVSDRTRSDVLEGVWIASLTRVALRWCRPWCRCSPLVNTSALWVSGVCAVGMNSTGRGYTFRSLLVGTMHPRAVLASNRTRRTRRTFMPQLTMAYRLRLLARLLEPWSRSP